MSPTEVVKPSLRAMSERVAYALIARACNAQPQAVSNRVAQRPRPRRSFDFPGSAWSFLARAREGMYHILGHLVVQPVLRHIDGRLGALPLLQDLRSSPRPRRIRPVRPQLRP
jgi:hypothetical protein